jgi:uncharacterized protein
MSERDGYQPGVPCWIDTWQPDADAAVAFYTQLFGWETETFGAGESAVTLWRLPGYVGGEPEQPVSREVVGVIAPMPWSRPTTLQDSGRWSSPIPKASRSR